MGWESHLLCTVNIATTKKSGLCVIRLAFNVSYPRSAQCVSFQAWERSTTPLKVHIVDSALLSFLRFFRQIVVRETLKSRHFSSEAHHLYVNKLGYCSWCNLLCDDVSTEFVKTGELRSLLVFLALSWVSNTCRSLVQRTRYKQHSLWGYSCYIAKCSQLFRYYITLKSMEFFRLCSCLYGGIINQTPTEIMLGGGLE